MDIEQELLLKYGGGGETVIHPIALGFTLIMGLMMVFGSRRLAILALLSTTLLMPLKQRIVIASVDLMMLRILILFGFTRLIIWGEHRLVTLNRIDKTFIAWVISSVITYTLLFQTMGALINRLGFAFDALGAYFLLRSLCRGSKDVENIIKALAVLSAIVAGCMLIERTTGRNMFSVFGGVPELTQVRDGRLRCQGAFAHPLCAGAFGATMMPLMVSLWWGRGKKKLGMLGIIATTVIVITSASSGPILAYVAGIGGLCMWVFRRQMRTILWGSLFGLIALHIVMKAPVWALLMRVKVFGASTGYHRFYLLDTFIRRFDEWWLIGTKFTSHWGYDLWDLTNTYIHMGIDGGLITLTLFTLIIVFCFKALGRTLAEMEDGPLIQRNLWSFGACLFSHTVAFFGISYFDQMQVVWYVFVAMISITCVCSEVNCSTAKEPTPAISSLINPG